MGFIHAHTFTDPYFEPPETLDVVIQLCHFSVDRPRAYTTTVVDLVIRIKTGAA